MPHGNPPMIEMRGEGRRAVTVACPFCGMPRDDMFRKNLPGHLPECPERPDTEI